MRKDPLIGAADTTRRTDPAQQKETLKFLFTPRQALAGERERLLEENPHAKASTYQPDLVEALQERFGDAVVDVAVYAAEHTVVLGRDAIVDACR
ncbi:MAG: hypothetical protein R3362_00005, partial [Rhodothermales bacterium]|nr:hypothetical protein [Rhodothermales bacterium]